MLLKIKIEILIHYFFLRMASTIIQSYLKPILDSYLTSNAQLRINIFNCLSMILNQGLVYPIECVPYLIAMTTDNEKKIQSKSNNCSILNCNGRTFV